MCCHSNVLMLTVVEHDAVTECIVVVWLLYSKLADKFWLCVSCCVGVAFCSSCCSCCFLRS